MTSLAEKTTFRFIKPRASLQEYVDTIWISDTLEPHVLHILPTNRPLLMTCDTPTGFGVALVGPLTSAQRVSLQQGNRKVGAWFKPGTRCSFWPGAMETLRDSTVFGTSMQPSETFRQFDVDLQRFIEKEPAMIDRLQDLLEYLVEEQLLVRDMLVDTFIHRALQNGAHSTLRDVLYDMPISYRQFVRRFKQYTGLTPKAFLSTVRMAAAISSVVSLEQVRFADTAADHGYADHAHFTRDLGTRTNITPSALADKQIVL